MKNKKFKLFASLTSLVMVVAVMAVGVWAAQKSTANVTGTLSFTTSANVIADVEVSIEATNEVGVAIGGVTSISFTGGEENEGSKDLGLGTITLTPGTGADLTEATTITITIKVTNNNPGYNLDATIGAGITDGFTATTDKAEGIANGSSEELVVTHTTDALIEGFTTTFTIPVALEAVSK